jgi:chromosome segregation ATPase
MTTADIASLRSGIKRYEKYNNRLEDKIAQLKGEMADLKAQLAEKDKEIADQDRTIKDLAHVCEKCQILSDKDDQLAALTAERDKLKELVRELRDMIHADYKNERCDHNVNVCYCGVWEILERAEEALKEEGK